jgi:hypothetical protein
MRSLESITRELLSLPIESRILLVETLTESLNLEDRNVSKISTKHRDSLFGSDKGKVTMSDDFESPLEEFSEHI